MEVELYFLLTSEWDELFVSFQIVLVKLGIISQSGKVEIVCLSDEVTSNWEVMDYIFSGEV